MDRVRRAVSLLVIGAGVLSFATGCQNPAQGCAALLNLAVGVGVAVGTYYLVEALK